ncbi:hypothetical protein PVAP13_6KG256900 [Panicum virgatum]|uniref:1-phosphatidylinositol-3-phosphate 5-kinase n=1 Tax=Panicum virgatum TaxID=38727 RepID=A0A8T0RFX2_PANVG|nr:hypothetical protein PVAP13_6KG256900 [Panicum virgatum]
MGVVDFSVLGALQKVRSFVAGPSPAEAADGRPAATTPMSGSGGPSPADSPPPAAARSGGRRAIALRRQISSPQLLRCRAVSRADGNDDLEPGVQFFTPGNDFLHDFSDTDSVSVSTPNGINRSLTPSPLESPTWMVKQNDSPPRSRKNGGFSPDPPGYGTTASDGPVEQMNGSITGSSGEGSKTQNPVDFGANIWCPPPPEDEDDDIESRLFGFDDEDDNVGDSSGLLPGSFRTNKITGVDEIANIAQKEGLKSAVLGHFRALVAQLLKAEGVDLGNEDGPKNWLDIVSSLTWQAASYVRPDTKKGGSMDPTDYVKVKCIASGDPSDSNFVRGVVCSKNVKHKRMVSEHRNAKVLILGGALEYHRVPNKLASIDRILEQEKEHLKMVVGKIESLRPNVVLVEKSASSSAQELFSKDISLVLNVKRPLLDRISRCTGAQIASSVDSIASARLGRCEMFKVQKVTEFSSSKQTNRRSTKTLMFFEGCPWRLGCTAYCCQSCKEPSESHIRCYTHQHGSLTISVRRLRSRKLPGERDGRIWMWHRCLKCEPKDGVPPATRRIIMSDAAWGLSFGKFLELSFSNHATANRVASCGHSLQRDCLRFYGYGNMVAFFRYSPVDILSVNLPLSILDFNCRNPQEWLKRVAIEIFGKMESLHVEVSEFLHRTERNIVTEDEPVKEGVQRQIIEMKDLLKMERNEYEILLLPVIRESRSPMQASIDILELNRLRRGLLLDAYIWDRRLCHVDSLLKTHGHVTKISSDNLDILLYTRLKEWKADLFRGNIEIGKSLGSPRKSLLSREGHLNDNECSVAYANLQTCLADHPVDGAEDLDKVYSKFNGGKEWPVTEPSNDMEPVERLPSLASIFSDNIDLAWTGSSDLQYDLPQAFTKIDENGSFNLDSSNYRNAVAPVRIHSFNSTLGLRQRERTGLAPTSLHLSSFKSAELFRDTTSILKDPMPNMRRACSQRSPGVLEKLNVVLARTPTYVSSASNMIDDGARLLLPQIGYEGDIVVAVYDDEPTSIVSYAMTSEEYARQVARRLNSNLSFSHLSNNTEFGSHGLEGSSPSQEEHLDSKGTHFKFSFDDESPISPDKTKFSVICYFERHFAALRKKCCPKDIDYIRSLSRCKRWNAQGGKSNVYFAKTMDERFIIKQVTRTELESFVEFAPQYFKYLMESLASGSPTCLAKIVGLYQVSVKSLKAGKEVKMDIMVMENLFFERKISRVYDLKGSLRSRYTSGDSKVLLDSNLIEALHTKPIFLGSKAKRRLERAVWNDTSFLALADVMDYSLLVGIDEEKKELVIGIIDYLRQYTWDKQLETWVKASGILGGPKNESPTVISPMQYKKRFRKAMSKYFLTVPDQWSS